MAAILSRYWEWGYPHLIGDPPMDDGGFMHDRVRVLIRELLNRVYEVAGHSRPRGARGDHRDEVDPRF